MIEARNTTGTAITTAGLVSVPANSAVLFPADRCVFRTEFNDTANAYETTGVLFYPGAPNPDGAEFETVSATGIKTRLGYIGKTGRFVGITD